MPPPNPRAQLAQVIERHLEARRAGQSEGAEKEDEQDVVHSRGVGATHDGLR
jgi:hypothetical protein